MIGKVQPAVMGVDLHADPHEEADQGKGVNGNGTENPGQGNDAGEPEQDSVGAARREVIDLSDQGDVGEEKSRTDEVQRLAGAWRTLTHAAQPPTGGVGGDQQQCAAGDFDEPGNGVPIGGDDQDDAEQHEHSAEADEHRKQPAAAALQLEMVNDAPPLLVRDETLRMQFLDVVQVHNRSRRKRASLGLIQ